MNIAEAAEKLGISTKTLRNYIKQGLIEARLVDTKTGKAYEIDSSSLEAFRAQRAAGLVFPGVEGVEKPGKKPGKTGKAITRVEKPGRVEFPSFQELPGPQGGVIYLGPPQDK